MNDLGGKMPRLVHAVSFAVALCSPGVSAQSPSAPNTSVPIRLTECENNQCVAWTFYGSHGNVTWPDGTVSTLDVSWAGFPAITIRRQDISGHNHGLVATYSGMIRSNRIDGTIAFSWPIPKVVFIRPKPKPTTGTWYATILNPADLAPALGIVQTNCDTPTGQQPVTATQAMEIGRAAAHLHQNYNAVQCFYKAANQGNAAAQNALGFAYEKGIGTVQSFEKAALLYEQAAKEESPTGRENLINLYQAPAAGSGNKDTAIEDLKDKNRKQLDSLTQTCSAPTFLDAMNGIEAQAIEDPSVYAMRFIVLAIGVETSNPRPHARFSRALTARQPVGEFWLDITRENNDFVCVTTFKRADTEICPAPGAEASAEATALLMDKMMQANPYFREWFRISRLPNGGYKMTLVPNGLELSKPYIAYVAPGFALEPNPDRLISEEPEYTTLKDLCKASADTELKRVGPVVTNGPAAMFAPRPGPAPNPPPGSVDIRPSSPRSLSDPNAEITRQVLSHALSGDLQYLQNRFTAKANTSPVSTISARLSHLSHCTDHIEVHKVTWRGTPPGYVALGDCDEGRPRLWMILDDQGKISQVGSGSVVSGNTPEQIKHRARDLVGLLVHGKLADFSSNFGPQMQSQDDYQLLTQMDLVTRDLGDFKTILDAQLDLYSDVVIVRCSYQKGDISFEIAFDPALRVSAWYVRPVDKPRHIPQEFQDIR